mmetsp:Transcript_22832/g.37053  ORF Transcript_22832/g.37053 Transcript_22832/m.37053 type:complete len:142 (+) Transcript_22832:1099-1524(+)
MWGIDLVEVVAEAGDEGDNAGGGGMGEEGDSHTETRNDAVARVQVPKAAEEVHGEGNRRNGFESSAHDSRVCHRAKTLEEMDGKESGVDKEDNLPGPPSMQEGGHLPNSWESLATNEHDEEAASLVNEETEGTCHSSAGDS